MHNSVLTQQCGDVRPLRSCRGIESSGQHSGRGHLDAGLKVLICSITGFHSACSPRRRRPLRLRRNRCRRLWTATCFDRGGGRNPAGTISSGRRAAPCTLRPQPIPPVLTRPGGLRRVGRTRPLAPDWVARDRREKSGRAGQGYPAARRDGRRPASLVTRRGGVHRRWRRVGVRGRSRATNGATSQRPANAGASTLGSRRLGSSCPDEFCRALGAGAGRRRGSLCPRKRP